MENKEILLYLDDMRDPAYYATQFNGEIVWVKSYAMFDSWINKNGLPTKISFDYSLNDNSYDGISCVKSVLRYCNANSLPFPRFAIHSEHPYVYKLREYIEYNLEMEDYTAIEEDRKPDTEDQAKVNAKRGGDIQKAMNGEYDKYLDNGMLAFDDVNISVPPIYKKGLMITNPNKIGRNEICNCGSKLKYKKCCGK